MEGERVASAAITSAIGSGHRIRSQSGVVSRQMNSAIRNQVRQSGSSRLIGRSGSWSVQRVKRVYAVSNTMYGTATPVTSRLSRCGLASKFREK